jgi:hypothetical protein
LIGAAEPPAPVYVRDGDVQAATVRIVKPLTLAGINARMKPGVGKIPMLLVAAESVRIRDFLLEGNADSAPGTNGRPRSKCEEGDLSSRTARRITARRTAS